jgi:hypothetical protein
LGINKGAQIIKKASIFGDLRVPPKEDFLHWGRKNSFPLLRDFPSERPGQGNREEIFLGERWYNFRIVEYDLKMENPGTP